VSKVFDVVVSTGSYTGDDGQEKQRWMNVGAVFKNDEGRVSIKLDAIPARRNETGELWLSCFEPKPRQQTQNTPPPAPAQAAQDDFADDQIPF
jgi:hypothetical protein